MSVTVIQDLRWGDTGKGKISEHLSHPDRCDISVRAVGGGNAGHVIVRGTRKIALHLLPAGCLHEGVDVVLGRGMVTHLPTLLRERQSVKDLFDTDPLNRLLIAPENAILFQGHKEADRALERRKGKDAVGTTGSGIGPAYADKALRVGMRMEELLQPADHLKDRYRGLLNHWAATYGIGLDSTTQGEDIDGLLRGKELLESRIQDMTQYWQNAFGLDMRVVIEGAQGSLLSIDSEGYPYVTSSATTVNGHMQGAGIPHNYLTKVVGTLKAYDTRVGNGQMRTELPPDEAEALQKKGGEFGSTTGRGRRTGWLDLDDTAKRAWEEGVDELAVLKGDVLDDYANISFATGGTAEDPSYSMLPGWHGSIRGLRHWDDLPEQAQAMYDFIAKQTHIHRVTYIGTGPESNELIVRE